MTEQELIQTYISGYEGSKQTVIGQALKKPEIKVREATTAISTDPEMSEFMIQQCLPLYESTMRSCEVPEEDILRICNEMKSNPNKAQVLDALVTISRMHTPKDENKLIPFNSNTAIELTNGNAYLLGQL